MDTESFVRAGVARDFDRPAEKIFEAWLSSQQIANWMFGPAVRNEEIISILLEPKVGGAFLFAVLRDGRRIDHVGRYLEITKPNRLVFTWGVKQGGGDNSRVTVDIEPTESGCRLALTHEMPAQWAGYVDRVEKSWTEMLASLARSLS